MNDQKIPEQESADTTEKKKHKEAESFAKEQITYERARIAIEKMQLSWIRKSIMISALGLTIYKIFEGEIQDGGGLVFGFITAREIGLFMLLIGFVSLLMATIQHIQAHAKIKVQYELYAKMPRSLSLLVTYAILFVTLFLFIATLARYGSNFVTAA